MYTPQDISDFMTATHTHHTYYKIVKANCNTSNTLIQLLMIQLQELYKRREYLPIHPLQKKISWAIEMLCKSATLPPSVGEDANIKNEFFIHVFIAHLMLREIPQRGI